MVSISALGQVHDPLAQLGVVPDHQIRRAARVRALDAPDEVLGHGTPFALREGSPVMSSTVLRIMAHTRVPASSPS